MTGQAISEEDIFDAARRIAAPEARRAHLDQTCGDDPALRRRVESLLRIFDQEPQFLESPPHVIPDSWELPPGTIIGPYTLLERLGEGGMGVVYRAEQDAPVRGREVALKLIRPGMDSRQVLGRFETERQALALMDHPNIARILDAGAADARPFFVMEYIRGTSVTEYCDQHKMTPRQRLALFIPVCQAIQHAHQKGIIHRDIKPSNVQVTQIDGRAMPKIIDFGVAKAVGQRLTKVTLDTSIGAIIGTLEYMSPEQAEPAQNDIDTRSDIYSLGVLLYELLTGTTPLRKNRFKQEPLLEALRIIREEEPPTPSTRLSTVDELPSIAANRGLEPKKLSGTVRGDLDWIVMKCLEKDQARRYETANALARDLERYLSDEPVEARPPSARYRFSKLVRRNKAAVLATAACVFMLFAATAVSLWQAWRATQAERASRLNEAAAIAAAKHADEESAVAKAISQFLQEDLLGQADVRNQPRGLPRNKDVTVRTLLDRAAKDLGTRFQGQELTESEIRLTIGNAYSSLGEYQLAAEHFQRSLTLRKRLLGANHSQTLASMWELGGVERIRGRYEVAEPLLVQVCEANKERLGPKDPKTLQALHSLATLYVESGDYERGDEMMRNILEARREVLGPDDLHTLHSMAAVADGHRRRRESDKAEPLTRAALDGYRVLLGSDHSRTLGAMTNLAKDCSDNGRHEEAEKLLRESYAGYVTLVGADHPFTLNTLYTLGVLNQRMNRLEEAERDYRQALEGMRRRMGPSHPLPGKIAQQVGEFYRKNRRYVDEEKILKELLEIRRDMPAGDATNENLRASLAVSLLSQEKYAEAESAARANLEARLRQSHSEWDVADSQTIVGRVLAAQKKFDEAEPWLAKGVTGLKEREAKLGTKGQERLADGLKCLVQLYEATGKADEAAKWRQQLPPADAMPKN